MRTTSSRSRRIFGLAIAGMLLLAACGSDEEAGDTATTTSTLLGAESGSGGGAAPEDSAAPDVTDPPATEPATTDPAVTEPPETVPPSASGCLVGVWELRSQEFLDEIVTTFADGVAIDWQHVGGEYLVTMNGDGTYLGERKEWQFRIATPEGALVTTITSADPGTYEVEESIIHFNDLASEATVKLQIEVDGVLQDIPVVPDSQTVDTDSLSGSGEFTCEGDVLTTALIDEEYPDGIKATFDRTTA